MLPDGTELGAWLILILVASALLPLEPDEANDDNEDTVRVELEAEAGAVKEESDNTALLPVAGDELSVTVPVPVGATEVAEVKGADVPEAGAELELAVGVRVGVVVAEPDDEGVAEPELGLELDVEAETMLGVADDAVEDKVADNTVPVDVNVGTDEEGADAGRRARQSATRSRHRGRRGAGRRRSQRGGRGRASRG